MVRFSLTVLAALAALAATASQAEVPTSPFAAPGTQWQLAEFDGGPFEGVSTLVFSEDGRVGGRALCNRFTGGATWSPETLSFGPLGTTMMACPGLEQEREVLQALSKVETGGIVGDELVLGLSDGGRMVYRAAE